MLRTLSLSLLPHHHSDASVSDADPDLGLLGAGLSVGHTDDVGAVGRLDIADGSRDGHTDLIEVGAV